MAKGTRVGSGGSHGREAGFAARVARVAAAGLISVGGLTAGPGVAVAAAQADGAFTTDQASSGWSVYGVQCGDCHGPNLEGMVHAPPLSGVEFLNSWAGETTSTCSPRSRVRSRISWTPISVLPMPTPSA